MLLSGVVTDPPREIGTPLIVIAEFTKAVIGMLVKVFVDPDSVQAVRVLFYNVCVAVVKTFPYVGTTNPPPNETVFATPSIVTVNDEFCNLVLVILLFLIDGVKVKLSDTSNFS